MDQIILLSSGCVLNQIVKTGTKLMTGLMRKLQSARISNVVVKAQRFKASLKDTNKLDWATAKTVHVHTTPKTQKNAADLAYNLI